MSATDSSGHSPEQSREQAGSGSHRSIGHVHSGISDQPHVENGNGTSSGSGSADLRQHSRSPPNGLPASANLRRPMTSPAPKPGPGCGSSTPIRVERSHESSPPHASTSTMQQLSPPSYTRPSTSAGEGYPHQESRLPAGSDTAEAASAAFRSPEDSEGEYVRRTYLHFDRLGITNDGAVEGKEWTRNRTAGQTPWGNGRPRTSHSTLKGAHNGSKICPSEPDHATPASEEILREDPSLSPSSSRDSLRAGRARSSAQTSSVLSQADGLEHIENDKTQGSASTSSLLAPPARGSPSRRRNSPAESSHMSSYSLQRASGLTALANNSQSSCAAASEIGSEMGSEEWSHQRQSELKKREALHSGTLGRQSHAAESRSVPSGEASSYDLQGNWADLDRYGFFGGKDWGSQASSGRVVLLPASCFDFVPTPDAPLTAAYKGKSKAAAAGAMTTLKRVSSEGSPGAVDVRLTHTGSIDVVNAFRADAESRSRGKEAERIDKWCAMLAPSEVRGGNTTSYRIRDSFRNSSKLESRVFKGVPDRWRAGVWWALVAERWQSRKKQSQRTKKGKSPLAQGVAPAPPGTEEGDTSYEGAIASANIAQGLAVGAASSSKEAADAGQSSGLMKAASLRRRGSKRGTRRHESPMPSESSSVPTEPLTDDITKDMQRPVLHRETSDAPPGSKGVEGKADPAGPASDYHRLLQRPSPHDVQIDLDVPRTINNHILFHTRYGHGQRSLFKVLHSYSLLCNDCGYCQGMGGIAVTLLCYFPEEATWELMRRLHSLSSSKTSMIPTPSRVFTQHDVFRPGFPGLMEYFWVQKRLLELLCPDVAALLEAESVASSSFATRWYITMFYNVVPFETQLRLWDAVMLRGSADVLPVFGVAILFAVGMTRFFPPPSSLSAAAASQTTESAAGGQSKQQQRQRPPTMDFEAILSTLSSSNLFVPEDDEAMMRWVGLVLRDKRVVRQLEAARVEWRGMVQRGEDLTVIL